MNVLIVLIGYFGKILLISLSRVKQNNNVYVEETDLLENNELLLKPRPKEPSEKWMEAQILPGDTLQALALRFHCTVS